MLTGTDRVSVVHREVGFGSRRQLTGVEEREAYCLLWLPLLLIRGSLQK